MPAILLFAVVLFVGLAYLLARYAPSAAATRARLSRSAAGHDEREAARMPRERLRVLVEELLRAMGIARIERSDGNTMIAVRPDPFREIRYVIFVEDAPAGGLVEQPRIVELGEAVKSEGAQVGLLITPFEIARGGLAGLEVPVELIDGKRLRELVQQHLPARVEELERYRAQPRAATGMGTQRPLLPEPTL